MAATPSLQPQLIARLDQPTISTLRSSSVITSVAHAVTELVQNALDAHARQIGVVLDLERWGVRVHDDGTGITRQAVEHIGHGRRYATSKADQHDSLVLQSTFGFKGEALASLAAIASLEIASSTTDSPESWSSFIKGSNPISSGPSKTYKRTKPGTTVVVKDLFFNLPVRRLSHPSPSSTLNACRRAMETAAMLFPEVSFSLVDRAKEREPNGGRIWVAKKTSSIISRFSDLHGATLVQSVTPLETWERPDSIHHQGEMRIDGFISLHGAHTRAYQYLYVNRHPLAWCDLHRTIETRFDRSGFARAAVSDASPGSPSRSRRSPRKLDRKPVYVLNLSVPSHKVDLNLDQAKSAAHFEDWSAVTSLVVSAVDAFLDQHGLSVAPNTVTTRLRDQLERGSPSPSPTKRARTTQGRIDAARVEEEVSFVVVPSLAGEGRLTRWQDPLTQQVFLIDPRTGHCFSAQTRRTHGIADDGEDEDEDEDARYGAARRRRSLKPNPSTCCDRPDGDDVEGALPDWLQTTLQHWDNPIFISRQERAIPAVPQHLPPSRFPFAPDDPLPPSTASGPTPFSATALSFRNPTESSFRSATHYFDYARARSPPADRSSTSQFSKAALRTARVISQVDRKFIACILPGEPSASTPSRRTRPEARSGGTLVLIDQHAADERVRVERFLKQVGDGFLSSASDGGGIPRTLTPSLLLLLTPGEHSQLVGHSRILDAFARWGIELRLPDPPPDPSLTAPVQIHVDTVPTLLVDRLGGRKTKGEVDSGVGREAPRELAELVQAYLARLAASDEGRELEAMLRVSGGGQAGEGGLAALRFCPREMLDLINSKACRGAIMFNDPLTLSQSIRLIADLSKTVFPFQCAHGRPSIVPLADLNDFSASKKVRSTRRRRKTLDWEGLGLDT